MILFLMAATSHDFWMANLTAPVWKSLHMLVYLAYGLLVLHVTLGVLQAETSPVLAGCKRPKAVSSSCRAGFNFSLSYMMIAPIASALLPSLDDTDSARLRPAC